MTAIIAWTLGDDAFIIADSALTREGNLDPSKLKTSVGEAAQHVDGRIVEEGAAKLFCIGTNLVAGICGNEHSAVRFLEELTASDSIDLHAASKRAYKLVERLGRAFEVTMLIRVPEHTRILSFSSDDGVLKDHTDKALYCTGSLPKGYLAEVLREVPFLAKRNLSASAHLAGMLAVAQSLGIHNNLLEHGVGGAFFGARIGPGGFAWQDDTAYVIYQPDFTEVGREVQEHELDEPLEQADKPGDPVLATVCSRVRENVLTVVSTVTKRVRVFGAEVVTDDTDGWLDRHRAELGDVDSISKVTNLVFIPVLEGSLVVIPNDGAVYRWTKHGRPAIRSDFAKDLQWRPTAEKRWRYLITIP